MKALYSKKSLLLGQMVLAVSLGLMMGFILIAISPGSGLSLPFRSLNASRVREADAGFPSKFSLMPTLDKPMTLLLMGVDSNGPGCQRWVNTRSDTMILATLNPVEGKVGLVSIPRDSRIALAEGYGIQKINAAHALGGPSLAVKTVQQAFGLSVDHFVVIDTQGLKALFEALGPIEVLVEKNMHYVDRTAGLNVNLQPGLQILTSSQTEEYLRFRHDALGDIGRVERQQWFLRQLAHQLKAPQTLLKLPQLAAIAQEFVVTDLPFDDMIRIINFLKTVEPQQVRTATLPGSAATINGGSYWIPDMNAATAVLDRLIRPAPGNSEPHPGQTSYTASGDSGVTVSIKYPKGTEAAAQQMEELLHSYGYSVLHTWRQPLSDCQHAAIVQNSTRATDESVARLRRCLPDVANWPVVMSLDPHPATDVTLIITPATTLMTASSPPSFSQHPGNSLPN